MPVRVHDGWRREVGCAIRGGGGGLVTVEGREVVVGRTFDMIFIYVGGWVRRIRWMLRKRG